MEENKKPENPKAFPMSSYALERGIDQHQGMTLRDYFAAKAMQALLSNQGNIEYIPGTDEKREKVISFLSIDAFDVADEMLKQRNK